MLTNSKKETSANGDQPLNSRFKYDLRVYLQEADKALLERKYTFAHSCLRLAIKELNNND